MSFVVSTQIADIIDERKRQVEKYGWTPEHDDTHTAGEMAYAASCYAVAGAEQWQADMAAGTTEDEAKDLPKLKYWPWEKRWWKPVKDRRRNLVKAAALIVAEIERIDRIKASSSQSIKDSAEKYANVLKGISQHPISSDTPNKETIDAMSDARSGRGVKSFDNLKDLMEDLNKEDDIEAGKNK